MELLAIAGVVLLLLLVVFALVRDRSDAPPVATLEGGASHLRGDEPRPRRVRKRGGE